MIPVLARTRTGLSAVRAAAPHPVVLVPTMGALHDGHRALLRRAAGLAGPEGCVLASVFVNPLQFGPGEDYDRYPRTLDADIRLCAAEGVSAVFAPARELMYPAEPMVTVSPGPMGRVLEGASRPGFFDGVLTVVLKLFQLVRPDIAVFGAKDAQQLALIRRMTADLDLGVRIEAAPVVRDGDGLASSSRNAYLSAPERAAALALPRALQAGAAAAARGADAVRAAAAAVLAAAAAAQPPVRLDYLALADPGTFAEAGPGYAGPALLLAAVRVGTTRLIDNAELVLAAGPGREGHPAQLESHAASD